MCFLSIFPIFGFVLAIFTSQETLQTILWLIIIVCSRSPAAGWVRLLKMHRTSIKLDVNEWFLLRSQCPESSPHLLWTTYAPQISTKYLSSVFFGNRKLFRSPWILVTSARSLWFDYVLIYYFTECSELAFSSIAKCHAKVEWLFLH